MVSTSYNRRLVYRFSWTSTFGLRDELPDFAPLLSPTQKRVHRLDETKIVQQNMHSLNKRLVSLRYVSFGDSKRLGQQRNFSLDVGVTDRSGDE